MGFDAEREMDRLDETQRMRQALEVALGEVELTVTEYEHVHDYEQGCEDREWTEARSVAVIADELLAELERHGWKLVQVDPFAPARVRTDPVDIASNVIELFERVEAIEDKLATWIPQEQA